MSINALQMVVNSKYKKKCSHFLKNIYLLLVLCAYESTYKDAHTGLIKQQW